MTGIPLVLVQRSVQLALMRRGFQLGRGLEWPAAQKFTAGTNDVDVLRKERTGRRVHAHTDAIELIVVAVD